MGQCGRSHSNRMLKNSFLPRLLKKVQMQGGRPTISNFEIRISNLSIRGPFSTACQSPNEISNARAVMIPLEFGGTVFIFATACFSGT